MNGSDGRKKLKEVSNTTKKKLSKVDPRYTGVGTAGDNVATVTGQVAAKEKWKFFVQDTHNDTAISDQWRMGREKIERSN